MDNKAYMNYNEFDEVLRSLKGDMVDWRDRYDAVFHLLTAEHEGFSYNEPKEVYFSGKKMN